MKKLAQLIIIIIVIIFFVGCKKYDEITIIEDGLTQYDFVIKKDASFEFAFSVKNLVDKINEKMGSDYSLCRDNYLNDEDKHLVLIGNTNRIETKKVKESLKENSYTIRLVDQCLVIVGTDDNYTLLGIKYFYDNYILNNNSKKIIFSEKDNVNYLGDGKLDLDAIIELGFIPIVSLEDFAIVRREGDFTVTQGACCNDEYIFILMRDNKDSKAKITKLDFDGNIIATSEEMYLGHGNDMTYDYKNNRIIVSHGVSETEKFSIIDPNSLEKIDTIIVTEGNGGSIAYNRELDMYVVSKGGLTLSFLDSDFNLIKTLERENNGYTAQGAGADDKYIYYPMSGNGNNIIVIYNWNGDFVTNVIIDNAIESESLFYHDGDYYINFYVGTTGSAIYKAVFTFMFE